MSFSDKIFEVLKKTNELLIKRKSSLGDNLPRKLLYARKKALEVGLSEPQKSTNYLAIKLHAGNKRSLGELTSVINVHEDIS